jgi:uncharacterized Zn-binding protein involved in type VI secretion
VDRRRTSTAPASSRKDGGTRAQISRRVARHGDLTTNQGVVIAPGNYNTVMGLQVALAGDKIECPACKTTGYIRSAPPSPEQYYNDRRFAYGGDLCICGCHPPPRIIASVTNWSASNFKVSIALDPAAADWLISEGHQPAEYGLAFDQTVLLKDKTGKPLCDMPYRITLADGRTVVGVTNASGLTEKIYSNTGDVAHVEAPYYGNTERPADTTHGPDTCGC